MDHTRFFSLFHVMWTHGEAGSSALLFQIIPFSSECSITLSFCPDLSSLPHRTLVSSWPLWGGSRITSRKAAGSHPGEVTLPKSLGRITDSLQRAVPTPSVMSKAIGPGSLAGTLLLMPTHKHPLLPWGFLRLLLCRPWPCPPAWWSRPRSAVPGLQDPISGSVACGELCLFHGEVVGGGMPQPLPEGISCATAVFVRNNSVLVGP